jgi:hypothetical protein
MPTHPPTTSKRQPLPVALRRGDGASETHTRCTCVSCNEEQGAARRRRRRHRAAATARRPSLNARVACGGMQQVQRRSVRRDSPCAAR